MPRTRCCTCETGLNPTFTTLTVTGDTTLNTLTTTGLAELACLTVDTTTLVVDCVNNRVGVLDATPTHVLDVNGTFRAVGVATLDSDLIVDVSTFVVDVSSGNSYVGIRTATPDSMLQIADSIINDTVLHISTNQTINNTANEPFVDIEGSLVTNATTITVLNVDTNVTTSTATTQFAQVNSIPNLVSGTGAITNLDSYYAKPTTSGTYSGTITHASGLRIGNATIVGGSAITNQYGVYVEGLSGATNNYALYTNSGLVRLGGNTSIFADLYVDTNVLYVDSTNNFVGINTTPSTAFHEVGTATMDGKIIHSPTITNDYVYYAIPARTVNDATARELWYFGGNSTSNITTSSSILGLDTTFTPTGASLAAVNGMYSTPTLVNSAVAVTSLRGIFVRADVGDGIATDYTGALTNIHHVRIDNSVIDAGSSAPVTQVGLFVNALTSGSSANFAIYTNGGYVRLGDRVGVKIDTPTGQVHINQNSTTGAIPALHMEQDDVSEEFIRATGTAANGVLTQSLVDAGDVVLFTINGYLKINVQDEGNQITDGNYYIAFGTIT